MVAIIFLLLFLLPNSSSSQQHWVEEIHGLEVEQLFVSRTGPFYARGFALGLICSTDNGKTWRYRLYPFDTLYIQGDNTRGDLYIHHGPIGLVKSSDTGLTWKTVFPYSNMNSHQYLDYLKISPDNVLYFSSAFEGVFRSTDDGANWIPVNGSFPSNSLSALRLNGISSTNTIYLTLSDTDEIFVSSDSGMTWVKTDLVLHWAGRSWSSRSMSESPGGQLFFQSIYPFISYDSGKTVVAVGISSSPEVVFNVVYDSFGRTYVLLGYKDIYRSDVSGKVWTDVTYDIKSYSFYNINDIAITKDNSLHAGTDYGLYKLAPDSVATSTGQVPVASDYQVYPAFPNPAYSGINISFSTPVEEKVTITVCDALGRNPKELYSGTLEAGKHILPVATSDYGVGSYWYTITMGKQKRTGSFVILR